jgi:DNA-directed RNA polymerase sigma subunit (sigma70/sigma32)
MSACTVEEINTVLRALPLRDRMVVELYFGFDFKPMTLPDIGNVFGISGSGPVWNPPDRGGLE